MEIFNDLCGYVATHLIFINRDGNKSLICSSWRFNLAVQLGGSCIGMASFSSKKSQVVEAINLLGDDSVIISQTDYNKFEALIGDYFEESDESGCEDDLECGKI